jgi:hypothetical protein
MAPCYERHILDEHTAYACAESRFARPGLYTAVYCIEYSEGVSGARLSDVVENTITEPPRRTRIIDESQPVD